MQPPSLPQRQSLVAQTAAFLQAQIEQGDWREWLPSERALCKLLQVSRNTLRGALAQLQQAGRIRTIHGVGNQIVAGAPRIAASPGRDVALLTPDPIERLRPMQSLWIDDMRALLSERGLRLRIFHGSQFFSAHPAQALKKLVARNPHGCWIVMLAPESVQRWFNRNQVPCIIAGSTYPDLDLPFRDLDHRAMCRHAAGVLLGLGHRRLVMLAPKSARAGDLESENGFVEAVRQSRHPEASALVLHHDSTLGSLAPTLRRIRKSQPTPTGWLIANPYFYLAIASRLAEAGVRIPQEVSLISRDDDPFLSFIVPTPARYVVSPHIMARSLLRPVLELLGGGIVSQRAGRIMPEFFRGDSIAAHET